MSELPEVATVIFENDEGEILAYLRDDNPSIPFPHYWDLFGGHVEKGDSAEEALMREIKEELDIDLTDFTFFRKYVCREGDVRPNIKYVYSAKINKQVGELDLKEGERLRFFKQNEIAKVKFANILKSIILDYLKEKNA
ncbi:MAG: NUDIX domain-containing protein [bacterium]|nr:NUDIX domain-containing protein [bacterium]